MIRLRAVVVALVVLGGMILAPGTANAATVPVTCSTHAQSIHVFVSYVPYTYCYQGFGSRRINLNQVNRIETRSWNVTVLWKPPGGSWTQTGLLARSTLYIRGGRIDTIAVP
jgi:hypothetical protein